MSDTRLLSYAFSRRRWAATAFSLRRPMLAKVCLVAAAFCFPASSAFVAATFCFSSSSFAGGVAGGGGFVASSLVSEKNKAAKLEDCFTTVSLSKSTSSCEDILFSFNNLSLIRQLSTTAGNTLSPLLALCMLLAYLLESGICSYTPILETMQAATCAKFGCRKFG